MGADASNDAAPSEAGASEAELRFTLPPSDVLYATQSVTLQLASQHTDADRVQLSLDGQLIATVALPFTYEWNSALTPEGSHEWTATLLSDGQPIAQASRTFIVDRTPPRLTAVEHASGLDKLDLGEPVTLVFSEAVNVDTLRAQLGSSVGHAELSVTADPKAFQVRIKDAPLASNGKLSIGAGVEDLAKWPMGAAQERAFHIPVWVADKLSNPNVGWPALLTSDGDTLWAGSVSNTASPELKLSRWTAHGWSAPSLTPVAAGTTLDRLDGAYGRVAVALSWPAQSGNARSHALYDCDAAMQCRSMFTTLTPGGEKVSLQSRPDFVRPSGDGRAAVLPALDPFTLGTPVVTYSVQEAVDPTSHFRTQNTEALVTDYLPLPGGDLVLHSSTSAPTYTVSGGRAAPTRRWPARLAKERCSL